MADMYLSCDAYCLSKKKLFAGKKVKLTIDDLHNLSLSFKMII